MKNIAESKMGEAFSDASALPQTPNNGELSMSNVAAMSFALNSPSASYAGIEEMSAESWVLVRDNPRQRDTETRAKRAKHLRLPHPTHSRVNMARLPNGDTYKLDGHTRAYLWATGDLTPPPKVYADVWACRNLDEAKGMYGTFDSRAAVENVSDMVFGAVRENGVAFSSELLKSQRFAGGMRIATTLLLGFGHSSEQTVYDLFEYWLPELALLDDCDPTRKRFHTGIMAAALLTFRRYGPEASAFWKSFAIGGGIKINQMRDAVQALEERMDRIRADKKLCGSGNVHTVVRIALSAFDSYRVDFEYQASSGIKPLQDNSMRRWLTMAAKTKRRW